MMCISLYRLHNIALFKVIYLGMALFAIIVWLFSFGLARTISLRVLKWKDWGLIVVVIFATVTVCDNVTSMIVSRSKEYKVALDYINQNDEIIREFGNIQSKKVVGFGSYTSDDADWVRFEFRLIGSIASGYVRILLKMEPSGPFVKSSQLLLE